MGNKNFPFDFRRTPGPSPERIFGEKFWKTSTRPFDAPVFPRPLIIAPLLPEISSSNCAVLLPAIPRSQDVGISGAEAICFVSGSLLSSYYKNLHM